MSGVKISFLMTLGLAASWASEPVSDFKLVDMNPQSVRYGTKVSPRDYTLQVAGYYFGAAH